MLIMHAITHRPDHLPEGLTELLRRFAAAAFVGFSASWDRLMERNAARIPLDDILWDDGEPEDSTEKR